MNPPRTPPSHSSTEPLPAGQVPDTHIDPPPDKSIRTVPPQARSEAATWWNAPTDVDAAPGGGDLPRPFGAYDLLREIARGGMGVVYQARQRSLNRVVALKMILPGHLASEPEVRRFYQEARAAAVLDHPNIVAVHEVGEHDGQHFFTMTFVEGTGLSDWVQEHGVPPPAEAAALACAVADAVDFAHRHGVIHRDLKPANILLDSDGRPRVTDFGLAKQVGADVGLTATGQVMGTPAYMAPEQAAGDTAHIGPATDVYSLGGVLYFLLTGQAPFVATSLSVLLSQVLRDDPVPPSSVNPKVQAALEAICLKCLRKDPAERYPSAAALASALREAAASGVAPAAAPRRRGPSVAALAGAAALVLLLAAGWLTREQWRPLFGVAPAPTEADDEEKIEETVPTKAVAIPDDLKPTRRDFDIKVAFMNKKRAKDGVVYLRDRDRVALRISVARDAYVGVWTVEADGTQQRLFPNDDEPDHLIRAGRERVVPGGAETIDAETSKGIDFLCVIASTNPWEPIKGTAAGKFQLYKSEKEKISWGEQLRGLRLNLKAAVAQEVVPYRVLPR
jgi:serine/threonine protein kinase